MKVPTTLILATSDGIESHDDARERMKVLRTTTTRERMNVNDALIRVYMLFSVFVAVFFLVFFAMIVFLKNQMYLAGCSASNPV